MFQINTANNIATLTLNSTAVSMYDNEEFKKEFSGIISKGYKNILLDLSKADYISSVVIASLIHILKQSKLQSCILKMCGLRPKVKEIFEITNLDKVFDIYQSREDAIRTFR